MALQLFSNNAETILASSVTDIGTTLLVTTGEGALFNAPTGGNWELLTITDGIDLEIVKMTARSSDTLTVVRAQEGTTAQAWSSGASVQARITKGTLDNFAQSSEVSSAQVGDVLITAQSIPAGYLLCDGSSQNPATYPTLSALLGLSFPGSWTQATVDSGSTREFEDVAWSPTLALFVAISYGGTNKVHTSPDGETWTGRTAPSETWKRVIWCPELSIFLACGDGLSTYAFMTSADGITWTGRTAGAQSFYDVAWSPTLNLFAATRTEFAATNNIYTSPDGITWTQRTHAARALGGITWSSTLGLFIAGALTTTTSGIQTSPDGITWTERTTPSINSIESIAYSSTLGIAVACTSESNTQEFISSPDGITWTRRASPTTGERYQIIWISELSAFVCVGRGNSNTNSILKSTDGTTWVTAESADFRFKGVAYSPSLSMIMAVGSAYGTNKVTRRAVSSGFVLPTFSGSGAAKYYIKAS